MMEIKKVVDYVEIRKQFTVTMTVVRLAIRKISQGYSHEK